MRFGSWGRVACKNLILNNLKLKIVNCYNKLFIYFVQQKFKVMAIMTN